MEMNNIQTGLSTGELEVLLLLQRANLSQYFKSFIDHGGDDARQLVELLKDPNDFMDLVKLVGMDKKPLHVRRLRKVLQDFPNLSDREPSGSVTGETIEHSVPEQVTNPMLFNIPVNAALPLFSPLTRDLSATISGTSIMVNTIPNTTAQPGLLWSAISPILQRMQANSLIQLLNESHSHTSSDWNTSTVSCGNNRLQTDVQLQIPCDNSFPSSSVPFSSSTSSIRSPTPAHKSLSKQNGVDNESCRTSDVRSKASHHCTPTRPVLVRRSSTMENANVKSPTRNKLKIEPAVRVQSPISETQVKHHVEESSDQRLVVRPSASLMKADLSKLLAAFSAVVPHLPTFPFRTLNLRNSSENELQELLRLPPNDPHRLEGLRRHSAIFGRFDAPKRLTRPLRHFELCINKLTHWLVRHNAELVTQREHLFHIARQIVNITNYGMSSTQSGEILNQLKTKMQELVDEEEVLRNQVRKFNKDEGAVSQAQLKRQLERLVNRLHENLNQLAKYIVLYNSLPEEEQK
ncbi:NGFI-A-binding protein [Paragonimus heterotremus]|uniref:NGFI-A-binding protein n=1 Tax=Paragonimus heterotremus TaxID=100268 RepID=A0A8J4WK05_9TREM|nr:NGFI-A-binding protein [Paragonimus heterotremus]